MNDRAEKEPERPINSADITAEDFGERSATPDAPAAQSAGDIAAAQRRSTILALIVSAAFFMEVLDGTIITTAIPEIARSFGATPVAVSSGISAYLIAGAIFIPASAWLSDRFGARNVFTVAIVLFTLTSVACGLSQTLTEFTIARIVQGIGGAMMSPVGRIEVFRRTERIHVLRAMAFMAWPGLSAMIIGPPLGGLLTTYASWHWIFFINIPIGIAGVALVWTYFDRNSAKIRQPFDMLGFLLNGSAMASLLYGIESFTRDKPLWFSLGFSVAGVAIGAAAVWHARRHASPLLSLAPIKINSFAVATITGGGLFRLGTAGFSFLIPLMLQVAFGMTAFDAGLLLVCFLAGDLAIKPTANRILRMYGFRNVLIYDGLLVAVTGIAVLWLNPQTPIWIMVITLFAIGATRSVQYTGLNALIFADMPSNLIGAASTLNSMTQQLFMGLGVGLAALVLAVTSDIRGEGALTLTDFRIAIAIMLAMAVATVLIYIPLPHNTGEHITGHAPRSSARADSETES